MARASKGDRRAVTVRLPVAIHQELGHYCVDEDADMSEVLCQAVLDWWEKHPGKAKYRKESSATEEATPAKPTKKKTKAT